METIPYAAIMMLEGNEATLKVFPIPIGEDSLEGFGMNVQSLKDTKWDWCVERD